MACDENQPIIDIDLADSEVSLSEMPAAVNEFKKHTALARELFRKEDPQHNSPGPEISRDPNAQDPTEEDMAESKGEATPSRDLIASHERLPEAQNEGEDLAELEQEATPPSRIQAAWVTEAVTACHANKKVRFKKMLPIQEPSKR